jgi:hypothetical protein
MASEVSNATATFFFPVEYGLPILLHLLFQALCQHCQTTGRREVSVCKNITELEVSKDPQ